jgi:response regulator RpfG family c-di-GMP phosphodiesterase
MARILVVDDEPQICENVRKILGKKGYYTDGANNGLEAIEAMAKNPVELVLMDMRMPVMNGLEALKRIKKDAPDTEVIMVTAVGEVDIAVECMKSGAIGYLTKPINAERLFLEIDRAFTHRRLYLENLDYKRNLETKVAERTVEVKTLNTQLETNFFKTIMMFVDMIGLYDPFLGGHVKRVAILAERTGRRFHLDERKLQELEIAGLLHDLGRMGMPEKMRDVPIKELSEKEIELLSDQTVITQRVLSPIERLADVGVMIRSHLEWCDGRWFPDGLKKESIPLESRIICVANAYDEVKNRRRFKQHRPAEGKSGEETAVAHLKESAGKQFDGKVVEKLLEALEEIKLGQMGAMTVLVNELKEGMTLADDMYSDDGRLLLAKDNQVSAIQVARIQNYHKITGSIGGKIYVYQKTLVRQL